MNDWSWLTPRVVVAFLIGWIFGVVSLEVLIVWWTDRQRKQNETELIVVDTIPVELAERLALEETWRKS